MLLASRFPLKVLASFLLCSLRSAAVVQTGRQLSSMASNIILHQMLSLVYSEPLSLGLVTSFKRSKDWDIVPLTVVRKIKPSDSSISNLDAIINGYTITDDVFNIAFLDGENYAIMEEVTS
jgi:hypothetical protein